jgi:CRP-like cAMP-binding protein
VANSFPNEAFEDCWKILLGAGELRDYDRGVVLFRSGTPAEGVYLIEKGEVSLQLASAGRKKQALVTAGAGAILGLIEAMSGNPHNLTAETATTARICFVESQRFLEFLRTRPHACMQVVQLLSEDLGRLYHTVRQQGLPSTQRRQPPPPRGTSSS